MPNPSPAIEVKMQRVMEDGGYMFCAKITDYLETASTQALLREIVQQIAEKYVAENYQKIVEGISQDAIATLSVAESAAKIRESLERNIPERFGICWPGRSRRAASPPSQPKY